MLSVVLLFVQSNACGGGRPWEPLPPPHRPLAHRISIRCVPEILSFLPLSQQRQQTWPLPKDLRAGGKLETPDIRLLDQLFSPTPAVFPPWLIPGVWDPGHRRKTAEKVIPRPYERSISQDEDIIIFQFSQVASYTGQLPGGG